MSATSARLLLGGALLAAVAGCGSNVCEDAAEICADQQQVAAPDDEQGSGAECEGALEAHATCIAEAGSCAPDVVAACWEEASGESEGEGGGA